MISVKPGAVTDAGGGAQPRFIEGGEGFTTTGTGDGGSTPSGNLFGTGSTNPPGTGTTGGEAGGTAPAGGTATVSSTPHSTPATSSLNLLGQVESWGINPGTNIGNVRLTVGKMTGAQLQKLIKELPDGITYGLELDKGRQLTHDRIIFDTGTA